MQVHLQTTNNSLTATYPIRTRIIQTPCYVCIGYDPRKSDKPHPITNEYLAIWDTGASGSVISKKVAQDLRLKPIGKYLVHHAGGKDYQNVYLVNILLKNNVGLPMIRVTEVDSLAGNAEVLIGMDVISNGDFNISNKNNHTVFTFSLPGPKDAPLPHKPHTSNKIQRNDLCPCGSGKKYKNCCGKPGKD